MKKICEWIKWYFDLPRNGPRWVKGSDPHKVDQSNTKAGGDIVGRDKID